MVNELVVLEKAEKWRATMLAKREEKIYPIPAQLRKELDILKNAQVGNLNTQLKFIYGEKYKEFCEAHLEEIESARVKAKKVTSVMNDEAIKLIEGIREMVNKYNSNQEKTIKGKENFITKETGYGWREVVKNFTDGKDVDRDNSQIYCVYSFSEDSFKGEVIREKFKDRFGVGFDEAQKMIVTLEEKFKEALLFGDIELVKDIYFTMKKADEFLGKVQKLKVA